MGAVSGFLDDGESLDFSLIEPARPLAEPGHAFTVLQGVASEIATLAGSIATVASLFNAAEIPRPPTVRMSWRSCHRNHSSTPR